MSLTRLCTFFERADPREALDDFIIFLRVNGCKVPINEQKNNKSANALPGYAGKKCTKPRLTLLHGFLGNASDWQGMMQHVSLPCRALNLPGHGGEPFTPDFCQWLLDATKNEPPLHLVGYSMGGRLALQFRARHPEKVASLTILSSHLGLNTDKQSRLDHDYHLADLILHSFDAFLDFWYDQPIFKTLVAKMDIRTLRRAQNPAHLAAALKAFSLGHQPDLSSVPAQLLVGEFDTIYQTHYKNFPHTIIPLAGHAAHLENPKAVAGALNAIYP